MEQSKTAFLTRFNTLHQAYNELIERQKDLSKRINIINLKKNEMLPGSEINAEILLDSKQFDGPLLTVEKELEALKKEFASVTEKINAVPHIGGKGELFKTDKQLTNLAEPFVKDLIKQAKEDSKNKKDLEKRYAALLEELIQLDAERNQYLTDGVEKRRLLATVLDNTKVSLKDSEIQSYHETYIYSLFSSCVYQALGNAVHLLKEYRRGGLM
jgi:hypothetical protein